MVKTERGFLVKPLEKLSHSLLASGCPGSCAPAHTPGVRSEMRVLEEEPLLGPAEHNPYRTIVGELMFLARERPDIQFFVKECARGVGDNSARDMQRATRVCRYHMGTSGLDAKA